MILVAATLNDAMLKVVGCTNVLTRAEGDLAYYAKELCEVIAIGARCARHGATC